MIDSVSAMRDDIVEYCSMIGQDPLLVQGAGGNVSWKDGDTLWIKASGTWLSHAKAEDIFLPVDLASLRNAIDREDFSVTPVVLGESILKPSIETLLHALMPHPVVVHLHSVEILAHLIRKNWLVDIQKLLGDEVAWTSVPYKKPGADLAKVVNQALRKNPDSNVIFLQNHGVVIGGNHIEEVDATLKILIEALRTMPIEYAPHGISTIGIGFGYSPVADSDLNILARNSTLFSCLDSKWALYPDHVVFLGARAKTFSSIDALHSFLKTTESLPELIFLKGEGGFSQPSFNVSKQAQLRCYYDVLVRQSEDQAMNTLLPGEIGELLNWDAEQYRMQLSRTK